MQFFHKICRRGKWYWRGAEEGFRRVLAEEGFWRRGSIEREREARREVVLAEEREREAQGMRMKSYCTGDIKFIILSLELKGKMGNMKIRFLYNTFQNYFNEISILDV